MRFYQTPGGHYYQEYANGNKKRISRKKFIQKTSQLGGCGCSLRGAGRKNSNLQNLKNLENILGSLNVSSGRVFALSAPGRTNNIEYVTNSRHHNSRLNNARPKFRRKYPTVVPSNKIRQLILDDIQKNPCLNQNSYKNFSNTTSLSSSTNSLTKSFGPNNQQVGYFNNQGKYLN
jgi:hypothetical protein